jgi:Protein of unknown function (DUF4019)
MTRGMVWVLLIVALAIQISVSVPALAQQKPEELAEQSSEAWLALNDSGKYADSYDQAAQPFKRALTRDQWQSSIYAARDPLGKVLSRTLKAATYTNTLPGAPDGDYVVIQYESSFEHKQSAFETVTPLLDIDAKWRVSGYYIK